MEIYAPGYKGPCEVHPPAARLEQPCVAAVRDSGRHGTLRASPPADLRGARGWDGRTAWVFLSRCLNPHDVLSPVATRGPLSPGRTEGPPGLPQVNSSAPTTCSRSDGFGPFSLPWRQSSPQPFSHDEAALNCAKVYEDCAPASWRSCNGCSGLPAAPGQVAATWQGRRAPQSGLRTPLSSQPLASSPCQQGQDVRDGQLAVRSAGCRPVGMGRGDPLGPMLRVREAKDAVVVHFPFCLYGKRISQGRLKTLGFGAVSASLPTRAPARGVFQSHLPMAEAAACHS